MIEYTNSSEQTIYTNLQKLPCTVQVLVFEHTFTALEMIFSFESSQ